MKFNINTHVSVTLTAHGAEIIEDEIAKLPNHLRPNNRYKAGSVYTAEMWVLMQTFGPRLCIGTQPFVNCEIDMPGDPRVTAALNILAQAETCDGPQELLDVAVDARKALQS